ncbi:flagellar biosynthesis anti-sigma factor FlgM [Planctomycetota bacterium]
MARIATLTKRQFTVRRKYQEARSHQGREASHNDDARMDRILGTMQSKPWEQVVKKIDSLPDIRRGKVLNIRSQIAKGTYPVEDRLDRAADRALEDIFA